MIRSNGNLLSFLFTQSLILGFKKHLHLFDAYIENQDYYN
jgi:hypothetical protein